MSKLTPTNEESLIHLIQECPPFHRIHLCPSTTPHISLIDAYRVPDGVVFEGLTEEGRAKFHVSGFMAIALHPEVWVGDINLAAAYR